MLATGSRHDWDWRPSSHDGDPSALPLSYLAIPEKVWSFSVGAREADSFVVVSTLM